MPLLGSHPARATASLRPGAAALPCPARCLPVPGLCLMSRHVCQARHVCGTANVRPCRARRNRPPSPLQGQGLPCAASHRRGQEVSGPITMGLCAVSVLLSTDLVQFCTVFSLPGSAEDMRPARPAAAPRGAPAAAPGAPQDASPSLGVWSRAVIRGRWFWGVPGGGCGAETCLLPPQASLEVSLSQPTRTSSGSER